MVVDPDGERLGVARNAALQRLVRMSPEEHAERLRYDVDTVLNLQLSEWSDEAWEPVAEALAEYGYAVMVGWLFSGKMFGQVSRVGRPVPVCPQGWLDDEAVHGLAAETVAHAIRKFRRLLMDSSWKPERGASLATYFVGQCKFQFPNVYRAWLAQERQHRDVPVHYDTDLINDMDPAAAVAGDAAVAGVFAQMPPLTAEVFRLKVEGYTYAEIADRVDGIANAKAVENLVARERKRWRTRKAG